MAQIKTGTVSVTNGSNVVTGSGTSWVSDGVEAGAGFVVQGTGVYYTVAAVNSNTEIELSVNYAGGSTSGAAYVVHKDFIAPGYPLLLPGDLEVKPIMNQNIQKLINNFGSIGNLSLQGTVGMYPDVASGEAATSDGEYFFVATGSPAELTLYRRVTGSGVLIGTYPLLEDIEAQLDASLATLQAQQDAFQAAHTRLSRSLSVTPDMGETLRSDNLRDGHGLGTVLEGGMSNALAFDELWDVTRASTKTYVGADGLIRTAAANELPVSYDPETLKPVGRIVEEQRTNVLTWSQDLTNTDWGKFSGIVTISPNESKVQGVNYSRIEAPSTGDLTILVHQNKTFTMGDVLSFSFLVNKTYNNLRYLQLDTGASVRSIIDIQTATVSQQNGAISSIDITDLNNSLLVKGTFTAQDDAVRFGIMPTPIDTIGYTRSYTAGDWVEVTALQLEQGSTPSSYIPTTSAQVTRAADNVVRTLGDDFNVNEGTFYIEFIRNYDTTDPFEVTVMSLEGAGELLAIECGNGTTRIRASASGYNTMGYSAPFITGEVTKVALTLRKNGETQLCVNGSLGNPASNQVLIDILADFTTWSFKRSVGLPGIDLFLGNKYLPYSFTATELQALTS